MKFRDNITKKTLKDHFAYSWWQYFLALLVSIFFWNMYFIQTAYRPPEDKKIDVYIQSNTTNQDEIDVFLGKIWKSAVPEMESVKGILLPVLGENNYAATIQLTAYLLAGEGDIYLISSDDYKRMANQGAFLSLENIKDKLPPIFDSEHLSKAAIHYKEEDGTNVTISEQKIFGIPCEKLKVLKERLNIEVENKFLCISVNNQNDENVIPFFVSLIEHCVENSELE